MSESFEKAVEAGARRFWIEKAVTEGCDRDWAESAWDDMGGSEPNTERAVVELLFRDALTDALPHLTTQDVPHVIRQAKAEAWDEGLWAGATYHPSRRDFEDMRLDVEPVPPANPYAALEVKE